MRVHFELKFGASSIEEATAGAYNRVAEFMQVTEESVSEIVDLELKISVPDPEKDKGIDSPFLVTAFGNIKNSISKPIFR